MNATEPSPGNLPSGTVTFLFTDVEGSTRRWEDDTESMARALVRHDEVLRAAIRRHSGFVFATGGDGFAVAFGRASDALSAAIEAQRALQAEEGLPVRMAVHTGEAIERDGDYFGPAVNRAARLNAVGHGGQTLVSGATARLVGAPRGGPGQLRDLGEHRLKDLSAPEHVFQVVVDGLRHEFPPLRSLDNPDLPNNLPRSAASFVGRDVELAHARDLVANNRLVTLTGPGGAGKTRLAVQIAAELLDGSGDGVWIVDLAPITDATMVPAAIADTLGVRTTGSDGSIDGLVAALADRRVLVVLDNCEHLIDAAATAADRLMQSCAGVDLIATSREPLGVPGEVVYRVPSLGLPDALEGDPAAIARAESVRLFVERARLHDVSFAVDANNATTVAAVCRRLDGIPLALELAAARLRSMSADELLTRLDQRFRLLTGGSRTAMARQQTLRATIDWSFELLDARERLVLTRASVFAGGWDVPAAEAITSDDAEVDALDVLDILTGLVDKSLVNVESAGTTRYWLLETIREYAAEKLAGDGTEANVSLRRAHLAHYLSRAEVAAPRLRTEEQGIWLARLEADHENLRAALVAAYEIDAREAGLRLGIALREYAWGRPRCRDLVEPLSALVEGGQPNEWVIVDALVALAFMHLGTADNSRAADATLEPALAAIRGTHDGVRLAEALFIAGWSALYAHEHERAEALGIEGLAAAEGANDLATTSRMHGVVAVALASRGDLGRARRHFAAELAGYVEMGDGIAQAMCGNNHGWIELEYGHIDIADELLEPAEKVARDLDITEFLATIVLNRASVADLRGDEGAALALAVEGLWLVHRHAITRLSAGALVSCARALFRADARLSATMQGAIATALEARGVQLPPLDTRLRSENEARLRVALGDDAFEECAEAGRATPVHDLIARARPWVGRLPEAP